MRVEMTVKGMLVDVDLGGNAKIGNRRNCAGEDPVFT
jgi:hypothetical protein